jgi:hypothetical protein
MHSRIDLLISRGPESNATQTCTNSRHKHDLQTAPVPVRPSTRSHKRSCLRAAPTTSYALKTHSSSVTESIQGHYPTQYRRAYHTRIIPNSPQCRTNESAAGGLIPLAASHSTTFLSHTAARPNHTGAPFLCATIRIKVNSGTTSMYISYIVFRVHVIDHERVDSPCVLEDVIEFIVKLVPLALVHNHVTHDVRGLC